MQGDPVTELGPMVRILGVLIDAVIAYGNLTDEAWARVDSAIMRETDERRGRTQTEVERRLASLGVVDQHGIYLAAGLTTTQTEIAFLHYDRLATPPEIARLTGRNPITVRAHLYNVDERLRALVGTKKSGARKRSAPYR